MLTFTGGDYVFDETSALSALNGLLDDLRLEDHLSNVAGPAFRTGRILSCYAHGMLGVGTHRWIGMSLLAVVACMGSVYVARAEPALEPMALETRARELLAAGVEQSVSPQTLAKLGPELPDALLAIFERTSEARYVRLRALSMLSHFPQPRVTQLFLRLVHEGVTPAATALEDALHPGRSALVLRRAIESIATRRAPQLELEPQLELDLTRALAHANAQVRRAAVLTLHEHMHERKAAGLQRLLAAQLARESSPMVIDTIKALRDRSARSQAPRPISPKTATPPR